MRTAKVVALLVVVSLSAVRSPSDVSAQEPRLVGELPPAGTALVSWSGGHVNLLWEAAWDEGCRVSSVWATRDGELVGYLFGAPHFVNNGFFTEFEQAVLPPIPLLIVCAQDNFARAELEDAFALVDSDDLIGAYRAFQDLGVFVDWIATPSFMYREIGEYVDELTTNLETTPSNPVLLARRAVLLAALSLWDESLHDAQEAYLRDYRPESGSHLAWLMWVVDTNWLAQGLSGADAHPAFDETWPPAAIPCTPVLLTPIEGELLDNNRTDGLGRMLWEFSWQGCPDADGYLLNHGTPGFPGASHYTTESHFRIVDGGYIANQNITPEQWRVIALVDGHWGDWSDVRVHEIEPTNLDPRYAEAPSD